jgi:hypothetical protein
MTEIINEVIRGMQETQPLTQSSLPHAGVHHQRPFGAAAPNRPQETDSTTSSILPTSSSSDEAMPSVWTQTRTAFVSTTMAAMRGFLSSSRGVAETSPSTSDLESQPQQSNQQPEDRPSSRANPSTQTPNHTGESRVGGSDNDKSLDPSNAADGVPSHDDQLTHPGRRRSPVTPTPLQSNVLKIEPPERNLHEYLLRGYYTPGTTNYQPRRSLDQYIYADIEATSHRDDDQVVSRYTRAGSHSTPKMFMVDQLWLWVLGKGSSSPSIYISISRSFS